MIPVEYYIILSAILFTIGVLGVLIRRNALIIFMSIELMLNAANLAIVAFSSAIQSFSGQIFVFFVIAVASAEVAVGLALIVEIFKSKHSIDVDQISGLKG
jgi:NADH-quinone oxidoreductase subunit K